MRSENSFYQLNVFQAHHVLMEFGIQNHIYNDSNEAGKRWVEKKENRAWYGSDQFKELLKEIIDESDLKVALFENKDDGTQKLVWARSKFIYRNNVKVLVAAEMFNDGGNKARSLVLMYRGAMLSVEPLEKEYDKPYWKFSAPQSYDFIKLLEANNTTASTRKNKVYIINKSRPILEKFGFTGNSENKRWGDYLGVKVQDTRNGVKKESSYITYEELLDKVVAYKNYQAYNLVGSQFSIIPLLAFLGLRMDAANNEIGDLKIEDVHKDYIEVKGAHARKVPITPGEYLLISNGFNGRENGHYFISARENDTDHALGFRTLYRRLEVVNSNVGGQNGVGKIDKEITYFGLRQAGQIALANRLALYHYGRLVNTTDKQRTVIADMVLRQFGNYDEKSLDGRRNTFYALWAQGLQSEN